MEHPNAEILRAIADGKKMQYRRVVTGHGRKYTSIWYNFDVKDAEACCNLLQPLLMLGADGTAAQHQQAGHTQQQYDPRQRRPQCAARARTCAPAAQHARAVALRHRAGH